MYEITKYVCDEDGKEFKSEKECLKYELELKYGAVIKNAELQLWDDDFKPINIDDTKLDIDHTTYFKCLTDRAADYLSDMGYEGGYCCIPDASDILTGELYVYDENEEEFVTFSEFSKQVRDIMKAFNLKLEDISRRMSMICCRKCDEPRCDGCNIYILERALYAGDLRGFMSDGYTIDRKLFLPRGTAKSLFTEPKYNPDEFFSAERKNKHKE